MPVSQVARGYIDGRWIEGDGEIFDVVNPTTEEVLAQVPSFSLAQIDEAIEAASRAFEGSWRAVTPRQRSEMLFRLADLIERDQESLIDLMIDEIGTPRSVATGGQLPYPIRNLRWYADAAAGLASGTDPWLPSTMAGPGTATLMTREPIGVVAGLTAYNFPINLAAWKFGGALASGCTIVLMCSQKAVLTTTALVELIEEAGFPPGAFNFVYGPPATAERLCSHPLVDFVTFTGSAAIGKRIVEITAPTLKRVVLELGGKSADIVMPGVDVAAVAGSCIRGFTNNAGQGCSARTRTLIHRPDYERYLEVAVQTAEAVRIGDPHDPATVVGPLVSAGQRASVAGYVDRALDYGGRILTGGKAPEAFPKGFFYEPTIIVDVENKSEIAQEELFGPVSIVLPYEDIDDAIRIANESIYGLNASVWGPTGAAMEVASKIRSGTVTINGGGPMLADHPWGGMRQSGLGREGGPLGFAEFFEVKHILWPLDSPF
jgi:aldehyde dehydrogenase (NAD+)/betaine-aldehyde dehydrogenase